MDVLSAEELHEGLKTRSLGRQAVILDAVDSTNSEVRRMLMTGSVEGVVVIADRQTGGRGRRGRDWVSEAGCGLWMTFTENPCVPPEEMQRITLAAGVAVCRAVEHETGGTVKPVIKWPNDVLVEGKKLCGILSESTDIITPSQPSPQPLPHGIGGGECLKNGASPRPPNPYPPLIREDVASATGGISRIERCIIVGVGVNTRTPRSGWGEAEGVAISLEQAAGKIIPRMRLAASILNNMEILLDMLQTGGFPAMAEEYRKRMLPPGSEVVVVDGEKRRRGRIEGLDDGVGLLVRLDDGGLERIVSGEITLRGVGGYV